MAEVTGAKVQPLPAEFAGIFLNDCPAWTRLEPQSVSGDPTPGLEARVYDPAWLLARQWQFGEFQGEDAGSPVWVRASWTSRPVDGWRPSGDATMHPIGPHDLLEPAVENEPYREPGLRRRLAAGAQFLDMLADAGTPANVAAQVQAACGLVTGSGPLAYDPAADPQDSAGTVLFDVLGSSVPDAERIAAALESAARPSWLPPSAASAAADWLRWYRGDAAADCWAPRRLEYNFEISVGPDSLSAPAFGGGRVDWYHFDHAGTAGAQAPGSSSDARPVWATPLRFAGLPADRYWQFEDAQVNLAQLEARPEDLARLALVEFAMVYSQDWLMVPLEVPVGSLTVITRLTYTTTFGDTIAVNSANDDPSFGLFEVDGLPGLLVPPTAPGVIYGAALEEVSFLRDEAASLGWAVERVVRGPSGDPRTRADEPPQPVTPPGGEPLAELDYSLQTAIPDCWIPLVPVSTGPGAIELRKGAMLNLATGAPIQPRGVLLRPGEPLSVEDEEVPREGVVVRRVPAIARRPDGTYARWITRRTDVGRGEAASRLGFDSAVPRRQS
jgi:hypothetical protein